MNFLTETHEAITEAGHQPDDVLFIGSRDGRYRMTLDEFNVVANFEYDDGFGSQQIASDLIIYFRDGTHIERSEFDGAEEWQYNEVLSYREDDAHLPLPRKGLGGPGIMWKTVDDLMIGDERGYHQRNK